MATVAPTGPPASFGPNEWLVEELYASWLDDPASVDPQWAEYFQTQDKQTSTRSASTSTNGPNPSTRTTVTPQAAPANNASSTASSGTASPSPSARPAQSRKQAGSSPSGPAAPPESAHDRPQAPVRSASTAQSDDGPAEEITQLRGAPARTAVNMETSLEVPTATSVRAVPAKLLVDNRIVINNHLARSRGGKVSFTHIIGFALVKALKQLPEMNYSYGQTENGKPALVKPPHVNLGLAIDMKKSDGTRQLLVPSIKKAETMNFAEFWSAYEELVRRARDGKLAVDDFAGTTISLTNPGTIGTVHSVPRLMKGQGTIIGVGAMEYPAEYQGTAPETLARIGVSKTMTLTSTYDHRIIQGAQSGEFLRTVHQLLLGDHEFYDEIFRSLRIPYEPIRWATDVTSSHEDEVSKQARVLELIHAYRVRGHLMADTDPLEYKQRSHPDLDVSTHGLTLWDLDREFATGSFGGAKRFMLLRDILGVLRNAYCRTVGIEYMHIQEPEQRRWIQERVEKPVDLTAREDQLRILLKLNQAEAFESFLQTKYVGQKRFSLEGGESLIPVLDEVVEAAAETGLDEVTIGMAHRGRLNVLANIVGKSYAQIFGEFQGNINPRTVQGSGDVKYHLGTDGEYTALDGSTIKVSLSANPSHLEAVNPVLEGIARAKQDILDQGEAFPVLPILIHGDAAFAGQGVVAETLNLSQLRGYRTGGTVHVVVNNQVGYTTSPEQSRSSMYCTDVARMVQAPIFHVNGDDPEACARVARMAFDFRQAFNKDVVIDMVCYRLRGHNEGDDPSYTQPLMYDLIKTKRPVRKLYTEALVGRGDITIEEAEQAMADYQQQLERVFAETRKAEIAAAARVPSYPEKPEPEGDVVTAVSPEVLKRIADAHLNIPDGFTVHPKVLPQIQRRAGMLTDGGIDWATAEIAAFGSLLLDGRPVRLAGQDSRRGTFVQRFAAVVDRNTGEAWVPLQHLDDAQAKFYSYDSLLSEFAAMGFEYGYSVARPEALVLWEAQFGDFVNGAQIIIDEFLTSGEAKWGQRSGVVLLLPHGYEGQGADHSSARIERFLLMGAEDAFRVAQPSSPASYFHLLRLHTLAAHHKPLIVFTPKSMLRSKRAVSDPDDFTGSTTFRPVLGDPGDIDPAKVEKVLLCSGKITWELLNTREKRSDDRTAIIRMEQLYPLPGEQIAAELAAFPALREVRWVQDEPENMGPWPFLAVHLKRHLPDGLRLAHITRPASTSPAVGSPSRHIEEQNELHDAAFA
ncbi:multifunctional oxoglutarate decarboxylase/oxoglutarate dehydrogenase thiamine pyrophosphate-binding subunit/dihydrolipoyllysine-residue succinyltransferase subunit [Phytoactinopolyspora alkaliphila]|uniref:2-oxoglutarate dehydrogenase E1 component n=1 Tax=Phytoactinopolyspora alkaliphila TaxID=1783498 RepID=A0A6N9YQD6_9ACTN|nr:multifunctional oxoglutarate decarboxylase/oxoglutarate dehydrogenase thiamine pyrophosphate-binding subunit/dihydrolipoyllysine-residue succinyltransferase subunit [Phytoactinopolyspora alkaliphila]